MFWSDWGAVPKIERSGMDGSYRQVILKDSVRWPNGLTVDLVLDKLYWVDAKLNTIGSSNLDGSDTRTILFSTQHLRHSFSISVFSDLMFWTEWDTHAIYQANKFTGYNITAITTTDHVSVHHSYHTPEHCPPVDPATNGGAGVPSLPPARLPQPLPPIQWSLLPLLPPSSTACWAG